jgi:hypothetical protein
MTGKKNVLKTSVLVFTYLVPVWLFAQDQKQFQPKLFQVTTAVTNPGDAVLIRGEDLDKISEIAVSKLADDNVDNAIPSYIALPHEDELWNEGGTDRKQQALNAGSFTKVNMLQQNRQSVKFIIPAAWEQGVYSVRLRDSDQRYQFFYLNAPKLNWVISEEGKTLSPGNYLRIQGKNLLRKNRKGRAVLMGTNKKIIRLKVEKAFDNYSVSVNIPADAPEGEYQLYYHNGLGGKTAWSEPLKVTVKKPAAMASSKNIFNVLNYGARGDGTSNETASFRAALNAAEAVGGGTVYVPRGRYMLAGELIIPPFTALAGESKERVQLFWSPMNWEINELPNSLLSGTHHFTIRNLSIWATRAWGIILSTGPVKEQGNITLENLIIRQSAQISGDMYEYESYRDMVDTELNSRWTRTGMVLRGENLKMRNCSFNSSGMYTFSGVSGFIQNCRFERNTTGVNHPYMAVHPKGLIFEDCYKQADGFGYAATIDESHDLYEARNIIPFDYTNDRECMTLDGGSGAYAGKIESIKGTEIMLPANAKTNQWTPDKWIGGGVFIIEGRGAGQYRRILTHTLNKIILDQPFLSEPDSSSVISITTVRKNLFFVNNEVSDAGAYQFYGSAQNCVIAGLKMQRSSGVVSRGSFLYGGRQPNWYIDIVDCELREGNYCHWFGIDDRGHSGYQSINLIGTGGEGLNLGTLIRNNRLYDFSYIRTSPGAGPNGVTDAIIENNSFDVAMNAIVLGGAGKSTFNVLIHNNHYKDVNKRLETNASLDKNSYLVMEEEQATTAKTGAK